MNSIGFLLFIEFFKIGLFTFGGGYASLPFLYELVDKYGWFSHNQLTQLIALSGLTPGPIGLNMATFSGYETLGLTGALTTSFALILPMIFIGSFVFKLYKKFNENKFVKSILYFLRPTSMALICSVGIKLFYNLILNNKFDITQIDKAGVVLIVALYAATYKFGRNPVYYMLLAIVFGMAIYFIKIL